ncbi:MAG: hypothetical protein ACR2G3_01885 [Solirubrobacterales bacterium]
MPSAPELISYRRRGGYAGLSQRLSVYEDGRVELHDRKTGKRTEVQATDAELAGLRSVLDSIPASRWHSLGGAIARRMLPNPHEAMRFEVRAAPGRLGGASGSTEADLGPLLAELDELLARAVRAGRN